MRLLQFRTLHRNRCCRGSAGRSLRSNDTDKLRRLRSRRFHRAAEERCTLSGSELGKWSVRHILLRYRRPVSG